MKLYDAKAVARFLDLTERRVRQLRDDGVVSEVRPGLYDLAETNRRYINYLRARNPDSAEQLDYNTERAKLVRAKRLNEEFDLKIKENQLHSTEDVEQVLTTMLISFKGRIMSIPAKLSPILSKKTDKAEIHKILRQAVEEALNELADFNTLFGEMEGAADDEESNV